MLAAEAEAQRPCAVSCEEALALFTELSDAVFPLFARVLDGRPPVLKVRQMKTRWGVCAPARRQITLNLRLAEKPRAAAEYVVLHEYAHFVHKTVKLRKMRGAQNCAQCRPIKMRKMRGDGFQPRKFVIYYSISAFYLWNP